MHIRENQLGMLFRQKGNQQLVGVLIQDFSRFEKKISNCCVQKRFNTLDMPIMSACQLKYGFWKKLLLSECTPDQLNTFSSLFGTSSTTGTPKGC